jgi:hypothetical protein
VTPIGDKKLTGGVFAQRALYYQLHLKTLLPGDLLIRDDLKGAEVLAGVSRVAGYL